MRFGEVGSRECGGLAALGIVGLDELQVPPLKLEINEKRWVFREVMDGWSGWVCLRLASTLALP
jgi:hypothetical protein